MPRVLVPGADPKDLALLQRCVASQEDRSARARRATEIIRQAGAYRWVLVLTNPEARNIEPLEITKHRNLEPGDCPVLLCFVHPMAWPENEVRIVPRCPELAVVEAEVRRERDGGGQGLGAPPPPVLLREMRREATGQAASEHYFAVTNSRSVMVLFPFSAIDSTSTL